MACQNNEKTIVDFNTATAPGRVCDTGFDFPPTNLNPKTFKKRESGTRTLWLAVLPPYHPKGKPLPNISSPVLLKIFWSLLGVPKMYIDVLKI